MAWRTTEEDVREIIDTVTTYPVRPFIATANALTDHVSSQDSDLVLSGAMLIQIELYLAAHFYAIRDPQYQTKSTGGASATFQGQTGMKLDLTWWGQQAIMLDASGTLAAMNDGPKKASADWLGLPPSEQTDYKDRS